MLTVSNMNITLIKLLKEQMYQAAFNGIMTQFKQKAD